MIKKSIAITIFLHAASIFAMQPKKVSIIKFLLAQHSISFTETEKSNLRYIEENKNNASFVQLFYMKQTVNDILMSKLGHAARNNGTSEFIQIDNVKKYCDHNATIHDFNRFIQEDLTLKICKKIISCGKITAYLGLTSTLIYGAACVIKEMEY